MKYFKVLVVLLLAASSLRCDRDSDGRKMNIRVGIPAISGAGRQAVGLPAAFGCAVLLVHQSIDTDGSHCFDSTLGQQFAVTTAIGPISAGAAQVVSLSVSPGVVTFDLIANTTGNCSSATSTNLSPAVINGSRLVTSQSVNLLSGANTVTLNINLASGNTISNCSVDVANF